MFMDAHNQETHPRTYIKILGSFFLPTELNYIQSSKQLPAMLRAHVVGSLDVCSLPRFLAHLHIALGYGYPVPRLAHVPPPPADSDSNFLFSGRHSSSPPPGSNSNTSSLLLPLPTPPPTSNQFYIIVPLPWPPGSVLLGPCSHSET